MLLKTLFVTDCDIVNYKKTCMFIGAGYTCSRGCKDCQNDKLKGTKPYEVEPSNIVYQYMSLPIVHAVVFGGLEPMEDIDNIVEWIKAFRQQTNDDIVIYTGDNIDSERVKNFISLVKEYPNIIIKAGAYYPGDEPHVDSVLGIKLASNNQKAYRIEDLK